MTTRQAEAVASPKCAVFPQDPSEKSKASPVTVTMVSQKSRLLGRCRIKPRSQVNGSGAGREIHWLAHEYPQSSARTEGEDLNLKATPSQSE